MACRGITSVEGNLFAVCYRDMHVVGLWIVYGSKVLYCRSVCASPYMLPREGTVS